MPLATGDEVRFCGAAGTVVGVAATTDGDGRGSVTYGGLAFYFRVLRAPAKGDAQFPYVATNDLHFRLGLVRSNEDPTLFCLVFDDLPAPLGFGRWVQGVGSPSHWATADQFATQDAVVMTVGWRPGTITVKKGGVLQNGVYADIVLRYSTSEGDHEAWWQPAYPYNGLAEDGNGVPLRDQTVKLGRFKTDANGVLWACRPDGTLEDIIFPRGIGALGNRETDRWTDGPEPERFLESAEVWYLQEHVAALEGCATTLDVGSCSLTINGPGSAACHAARYRVLWEGCICRAYGPLNSAGTATVTGLPTGHYVVVLYHPPGYSDCGFRGLPRQEIDCTESGGSYTIAFPTSYTVVATNYLQGIVYAYDAKPLAGQDIHVWKYSPPQGWHVLATTGADGTYGPVALPSGYGPYMVTSHPEWGSCERSAGSGGWWDPCLASRFGAMCSGNATLGPQPWGEGFVPWGVAGAHQNLSAWPNLAYFKRRDDGRTYGLDAASVGGGVISDPCPRFFLDPFPSTAPLPKIVYDLYDGDGALVKSSLGMTDDTWPPWYDGSNYKTANTEGTKLWAELGGKYEGSVVEADRGAEITTADLPEAARLGLEFGKWTQPLEHRSYAASLAEEASVWPTTFGDWECAYCGGPTWCEPDDEYTRGHCMQCADYGVTTDARSYLITRALPACSDWLDRTVKTRSSGEHADRLVKGWPRPEEYDESDDYLVWDWAGFGIPRWVAVHLVLGQWLNGTFVDGESVADAEVRLGRVVGPVQLKLMLTADYQGRGQTLRVACTTPDGQNEWRMVTIPVGASRGDLFPLNWYPHDAYPQGYTIDVTAMEKLAGDGAVYGLIVNDGPAWHSTVGIVVRHWLHSPYACDVALSQRDPFLVEDFAGRLHLVYLRDGRVMHRTLEGTCATWSPASDITAKANWPQPCREPSLSPLPHAELVATADTQGSTRLWRSEDDGERWE